MHNNLFILISCLVLMVFGCTTHEKCPICPKTHLDEIIGYHLKEAEKNKCSFEQYLELTKPYALWDVRPRNVSEVNIGDETGKPTDVCYYHYGIFNAYFKMPREKDLEPIQEWIGNVERKEIILKENGLRYSQQLILLTQWIIQNDHKVFVAEKSYERVDDIYRQNGEYWKYNIPQGSPYIISSEKTYIQDVSFSEDDNKILEGLKEAGLYGAVHEGNAVVFMIDGLLNYSYGYVLSPAAVKFIDAGPMFKFRVLEKVHEDVTIYYYFAN